MKKHAETSGIVIYEDRNKLFVCKGPPQWTSTFMFVAGLIAIILLGFVVMQLFVTDDQFDLPTNAGVILASIGMFFIVICWRIMLYRRKFNYLPLDKLKTICILDLSANNLLDDKQNILAPLNSVSVMKKMQLTSSSPELFLQWPSGTLSIVKGNPFSGGIGDIERVLLSKGIKKK